jgi:hypothetical protein
MTFNRMALGRQERDITVASNLGVIDISGALLSQAKCLTGCQFTDAGRNTCNDYG